jgi:hypothetical protein
MFEFSSGLAIYLLWRTYKVLNQLAGSGRLFARPDEIRLPLFEYLWREMVIGRSLWLNYMRALDALESERL